mgnify:CR=1 FL=1
MLKLSNIYLETPHSVDIHSIKSHCLRKYFNLKSNTIVAFINTSNGIEELSFMFEARCTKETLLSYSHLLLMCIQKCFPGLSNIKKFHLYLANQPISHFNHYHTNASGIFCHSIITRAEKNKLFVAHLNITPKDFAITILNEFQTHIQDMLHEAKQLP